LRPDQVGKWLGHPRFNAYLQACEGEHDRAVALYNWNAEVSAAFLEVLYHLEILFRNAIDQQFPTSATDSQLTILKPDVWLCDSTVLTDESREKVNDAIRRLQREKKRPTRGRVIASLSFGFWQALFSGVYEGLWRTKLAGAFPNGNGKRRQVANLSGPILHFRNRIAHHEAIFSSDLDSRHDQILTLAGIIDTEAQAYIAALSRVKKLLLEMP
jgi:hypothetical protein